MIWWVYNLLFPLAFACMLPKYLLRMLRRGGYGRNFSQRFAHYTGAVAETLDNTDRPVWIQAVSVGELAVAQSFMAELRRMSPTIRFVLTTNTSTGYRLAEKQLHAPDAALYFPLDTPPIMQRALRRIHPSLVVLVENEMWPNLIRYARKQDIPVIMINGRISAHSHRGYRKIRFITRKLLPLISHFCVQSSGDRDRLLDLGAPPDAVEVAGSAKYDIAPVDSSAVQRVRGVLTACGAPRRILLGGSTWPGEEALLAAYFAEAKKRFPDLLLVLVPRHAERREDVLATLAAQNLRVALRSRLEAEEPLAPPPDVLLVDTTGELRAFYACADVVFVGKSMTQTGGQNPIEPAVEGKPVVVGPHMENFPGIMTDFLEADALLQVDTPEQLSAAFDRLLGDESARRNLGARALQLVHAKAGATRRMAACADTWRRV